VFSPQALYGGSIKTVAGGGGVDCFFGGILAYKKKNITIVGL
jgi:hypothetical protein